MLNEPDFRNLRNLGWRFGIDDIFLRHGDELVETVATLPKLSPRGEGMKAAKKWVHRIKGVPFGRG